MSGAIFHYRQALKMLPDFTAAFQFLHVPSCHVKFHSTVSKTTTNEENSCTSDEETCAGTKMVPPQMETLIECKEGHCRYVQRDELGKNDFRIAYKRDNISLIIIYLVAPNVVRNSLNLKSKIIESTNQICFSRCPN